MPISLPNKQADHVLLGTVTGGEFELPDVHCEIYLAEKLGKVGLAVFKLPAEFDFKRADWPFEFSFHGEEKRPGNELYCTINITKLYRREIHASRCYTDVQDTIVVADMVEFITDQPIIRETEETTGRYLLSPIFLLSPVKQLEPSYTGEVKLLDMPKYLSFTLYDGTQIKFDEYYQYREGADNSMILTPYLVGEFEVDGANSDFIPSYKNIDDFMMLASFAARERSVCLGWELETASSIRKCYRWVTVPKRDKELGMVEALIFSNEFGAFIKSANEVFQSSEHKTLLREAVCGVLEREDAILTEYLKLYSALETLVLIFRKENSLEYILDEFPKLGRKIKAVIKEYLPESASVKRRRLLYNNLSGLNRVAFSEAFSEFKQQYGLDLTDLWCVDGGTGSLADIRNRLVHGDKFEEHEQKALSIAAYHLRFVLERCLLAYLGWPDVNARTGIHPGMVQRDFEIFKAMRERNH